MQNIVRPDTIIKKKISYNKASFMAQLIQMRQRIKAIETIKKITHAMRLIAMSTHLRLRTKKNTLDSYDHEISTLFQKLASLEKSWEHPLLKKNTGSKTGLSLIIVVGSQKGLCGNFNTELCSFFERELLNYNRNEIHIITVGKKISEYLQKEHNIIKEFNEFTINSLQAITRAIISSITPEKNMYDSVIVYSNYPKTFFTQKPTQTTVIPLTQPSAIQSEDLLSDYIWEQSPDEIMNFLVEQMLHTKFYYLLFQSLIAEQASRFIAMDNSTRNASELLETMRLNYNKVRQSKITRELTDLAGSFF